MFKTTESVSQDSTKTLNETNTYTLWISDKMKIFVNNFPLDKNFCTNHLKVFRLSNYTIFL